MTMREEFERQMLAENACTRLARQSEAVGGEYRTVSVERAWQRFQAAYAAGQRAAERERDEAQQVCAEAYQVVGSMLSDLGQFQTARAEKVLDNLSQHRMVHDDVLPWPSFGDHAAMLAEAQAILEHSETTAETLTMMRRHHYLVRAIRNRKEQG